VRRAELDDFISARVSEVEVLRVRDDMAHIEFRGVCAAEAASLRELNSWPSNTTVRDVVIDGAPFAITILSARVRGKASEAVDDVDQLDRRTSERMDFD
jgi:hypothetical protein